MPLSLMDKQDLLLALAQKRKMTIWPGYSRVGDYHDGAYECEFVSPYTKSAGKVDAEIFVLLQDWSSDESLSGSLDSDCVRYGLTRTLPTNKRLVELLRRHFGVELGDVYATNLFPFIKRGGISSSIPMGDLIRAAQEFALPQIEIVRSKIVICLGLNTFNAVQCELRANILLLGFSMRPSLLHSQSMSPASGVKRILGGAVKIIGAVSVWPKTGVRCVCFSRAGHNNGMHPTANSAALIRKAWPSRRWMRGG